MTRIERWALARYARRANASGRLVYVDERGEVHDLGAYDARALATITWAVRVAYRAGSRDERTRVAPVRDDAGRLSREVARLP